MSAASDEQAQSVPMGPQAAPYPSALRALSAAIRGAFLEVVAGFSLRAIVAGALPPLPPKRAVVRVVAIGKAAAPMMQGALDRWPDRIDRALVVTVGAAASASLDARVETRAAAHPIPDARSVEAAESALALASGLSAADLLVVLISGGASSLASLPPEGMSLADKAALVDELLASGASIRDVNLVRRHASRIKGGRLAAAAAPARVLTLAVSDVIGGGLHDIGSGPSVPDPTTVGDAAAALGRFAPAWARRVPLAESLKPSNAPRWRGRIVAGPGDLAQRLAEGLQRAGIASVRVMPPEEGDAAEVASRRAAQAAALAPGHALVIPCEPTLRLAGERGRGGRAGWVALAALPTLPDGVALLCGATDGADGSSGASGAVVTSRDREAIGGAQLAAALAAFDDAPVHASLGTSLPGFASGVNFADVHVVARSPTSSFR